MATYVDRGFATETTALTLRRSIAISSNAQTEEILCGTIMNFTYCSMVVALDYCPMAKVNAEA